MSVSIPQVQIFFLALTRVLAILQYIPVLGGNAVPLEFRIGLGMLLTMLLAPWQPVAPDAQAMAVFPFAFAIGRELIVGLTVGFAATLTFAALQTTGEMIGFNTGFNAGRILNPALGEAGSTIDQFFLILSLLFFLTVDGHHLLIQSIQLTFLLLPPNSALTPIPSEQVMRMTGDLINTGVQLALPAVGALVITDVTLGLLAKVAPQVQVFFIGVPLKIAIGLVALSISLSLYYPIIVDMLKSIGPRMLKLLGA